MRNGDKVLLCALAMSLTFNLSNCSWEKLSKKSNVDDDIFDKHFQTYITHEIIDNKVQKCFWTSNVVVGINKETNEVSRYIYFCGDARDYLYNNIINTNGLEGEILELFDLDTGELLYFNSVLNKNLNFGDETLNKLIEENDFYFLSNFYEDIDIEYKTSYTKEEINFIAMKFVAKNIKIKRLELSNYV